MSPELRLTFLDGGEKAETCGQPLHAVGNSEGKEGGCAAHLGEAGLVEECTQTCATSKRRQRVLQLSQVRHQLFQDSAGFLA
jgi:hypothetical protein